MGEGRAFLGQGDQHRARLNIIYRDLKPENILLDADGAEWVLRAWADRDGGYLKCVHWLEVNNWPNELTLCFNLHIF